MKCFKSVVFIVRHTQVFAYFPFTNSIAQFRIPDRTGVSCVKTHQSKAKAGKKCVNESSRTGEALLL